MFHLRSCLRALLVGVALFALGPEPTSAQVRRAARAERLIRRGRALMAAGDVGSALAYFREAIDADRRGAAAYLGLARAYLRQRRSSDALEVLRAGVRWCPDDVSLQVLLARTLQAQGAIEEAAAVLRRLAAASPGSVAAHRERGAQAEARGAWSEALAAYRAILALAEDGVEIPASVLREARAHAAALGLLTRGTDPVASCAGGELRAALCGRR